MKTGIKICISFILGCVVGYLVRNKDAKVQYVEVYKDSIIRDSIYQNIISIDTQLNIIEKYYEKEVSNIMSSSDSANMELFRRYIDDYIDSTKNR